jgi:long-chain acyl-CoA synthetase
MNAETLAQSGICEENVALLASNSLDCIVSYWSLLLARVTIVLLDAKSADDELRTLVDTCDCNWIVCEERFMQMAPRAQLGVIGVQEYRFEVVCSPLPGKHRKNSSDIAVMSVTSGATGKVKVVMLSHKNLESNTASHIQSLKLRSDDVALMVLPIFYSYAHTSQFLCHTRLGGSIVLYDKAVFFPRLFCELIEKYRITSTSLVPTLLYILDQYLYLHEHDLGSLRYLCCGGAPMILEVAQSLMSKLPHTRLVHTYGLTEASPRVTTLAPEHDIQKLPSIGKPIPGVEVQIVADDGRPVAPGEIGELRVRGENVMTGYYDAPEETQTIVKDGWLYTGDLARCDDEGYLYLVGRKKNIIITGGVNVSPEEIEGVLLTHPDIKEAVVKGEYRQGLGEVPVAYLSLDKTGVLSLQQVHDFMRGKLAEWKWPQKLYFRPAVAKTRTGKIRRHDVC